MEKPITKESRNRNDRGRNDRQDKVDKFEESNTSRLGQGGKNNSKNNNSRGGKNNKQQVKQPTPPVQEKKEDEIKAITLPETMTIKELADAAEDPGICDHQKALPGRCYGNSKPRRSILKKGRDRTGVQLHRRKEEKVDVIEELLHEEEGR